MVCFFPWCSSISVDKKLLQSLNFNGVSRLNRFHVVLELLTDHLIGCSRFFRRFLRTFFLLFGSLSQSFIDGAVKGALHRRAYGRFHLRLSHGGCGGGLDFNWSLSFLLERCVGKWRDENIWFLRLAAESTETWRWCAAERTGACRLLSEGVRTLSRWSSEGIGALGCRSKGISVLCWCLEKAWREVRLRDRVRVATRICHITEGQWGAIVVIGWSGSGRSTPKTGEICLRSIRARLRGTWRLHPPRKIGAPCRGTRCGGYGFRVGCRCWGCEPPLIWTAFIFDGLYASHTSNVKANQRSLHCFSTDCLLFLKLKISKNRQFICISCPV